MLILITTIILAGIDSLLMYSIFKLLYSKNVKEVFIKTSFFVIHIQR